MMHIADFKTTLLIRGTLNCYILEYVLKACTSGRASCFSETSTINIIRLPLNTDIKIKLMLETFNICIEPLQCLYNIRLFIYCLYL